ncbi:HpcH/HpaI aldolase/citrate lyase family protein [Oryzifoliimicrobium ureilyticus]|uniref:HpcH/HpaI aldolase/citrate lyase family protein n=1 Tax=Oryzifoliimicrobium ureilyticus TaxID=3113724 RepID=UPI0030767746
MSSIDPFRPSRLRRSVLCVPAINKRALQKFTTLDCDAIIFDLEDSVAPSKKEEARENLKTFFAEQPLPDKERIIRINALDTPFARADIDLVTQLCPDAVLLPKVSEPQSVLALIDNLSDRDAPDDLRIWAMIETARGILNAAAIAETGRTRQSRLDCFVIGLNDLRKETGVMPLPGRDYLSSWMMQTLLAARAYGLDIIDSVFNDFKDEAGFEAECRQGKAMGFNGKMLIHPLQIEAANQTFGLDEQGIREAEDIIAAFARPEAEDLNVIEIDGKMVERLHLVQAQALVHKAQLIKARRQAQGKMP